MPSLAQVLSKHVTTRCFGPCVHFNGELVANGSADLWDGSLSARINYDQTGTELGGHHVWTGSTSSGEAWAGFELGAGDNAASGGQWS